LYYVVSWILVTFHALWSTVLPEGSGAAWTLSIVGLVVVIRILLIPLFVKQIKAQRALQILQPEIKAVQKRFKDDRQKQSEELMKLYRENGTNPFSSCLPILLQMPIFFALFHVLSYGVQKETPIPPMTQALVESAHDATLLGAPISATFIGTDETRVKVVSLVLIILMSLTTFITQRQLLVKGVANADSNPFLKQQRILVYVFPVMFAVFGINFPIGVLVYWLTTNLWSMGQQFYVIRNNPAPGSQAYEERQKRLAEKAAHEAAHSGSAAPTIVDGQPKEPPKPARNQPKRKPRSQRRGPAGGSLPSGSGTGQSGTGEPSSGEPGQEEQA
jgi:YidC/Oxa1 family membrane protein insertase